MSDYLDLPPELKILIEKRELDDRRVEQRRDEAVDVEEDVDMDGDAASSEDVDERRVNDDRRQSARRSDDRDNR